MNTPTLGRSWRNQIPQAMFNPGTTWNARGKRPIELNVSVLTFDSGYKTRAHTLKSHYCPWSSHIHAIVPRNPHNNIHWSKPESLPRSYEVALSDCTRVSTGESMWISVRDLRGLAYTIHRNNRRKQSNGDSGNESAGNHHRNVSRSGSMWRRRGLFKIDTWLLGWYGQGQCPYILGVFWSGRLTEESLRRLP